MRIGDATGKGEPEAGAARSPVARLLEADERFHDGIAVGERNPRPAVVDRDMQMPVGDISRDLGTSTVLHRIVDEVLYEPP